MADIDDLTVDNNDFSRVLSELYDRDPYQAVFFAYYFGSRHADLAQYSAAWRIMEVQIEFPCCRYCRWAILLGEPHEFCQKELAPICELCGEPVLREEPHTYCDIALGHGLDAYGREVIDYGEPSDGYYESDFDDDPYGETEDPLAGDIDGVIANYEESPGAFEAHRLHVASQYGG